MWPVSNHHSTPHSRTCKIVRDPLVHNRRPGHFRYLYQGSRLYIILHPIRKLPIHTMLFLIRSKFKSLP